ncbi:rhodanese-like domain-containing protein [Pseudanabaena sp. FACHB-2040]|uniref:rhodanese-like domain-containing protein n=1 Tax=Pseudanabaena sp. FACHB-2040 TaxID=2692859 RepID=UPI001684E730|nr:rhodanese-like domain-containing protein [Pseudanabaena sp. FACHB-2040]MBD2257088.1 rhodanese-like domain-containing protein [Pseudanabaena sp. FACHB-2040]
MLSFLVSPLRSWVWQLVKTKIRARFPSVKPISTQSLATWLDQAPFPVLLDVRQAEEFAVSHLPGAQHTPNIESAIQTGLAPDQPIVAYCSVGYRSARLVQQLQQAGFSQVYNLEGSIFQWFNEGRRVVQNGETAERVHPYNSLWGMLLTPSRTTPTEAEVEPQQSCR